MTRARDDQRLVRRMLRGDESAFQTFFDDMFPRLFRFAASRLRDDDLAEEIVQSTLIKAIGKLGSYRGEAALFTWLCTFCRFEMSAVFRRGQARREVQLTEDTPEVQAALDSLLATGLDDPAANLERAEIKRLVQVTLDHLPRHYGQALAWKYFHGVPVKEIAARLGVGPKAAESLLTRARNAFRDGFGATLSNGLTDGGPA